jgi:Flp pilus assembly protein TadD
VGKRSREKKRRLTRASSETASVPPAPKVARPTATAAVLATALVIGIFAIYGQSISHPFLRLDDPDYVIDNDHVNGGLSLANIAWAFTAMYASNWHPLTWISHMIDVELFGLDAGKHLMVSVAIHALNSALLMLVLQRATRRFWCAAAIAALFAFHPLHVESVAWVAERKDVLSTLFFLTTLWLWIGWIKTGARANYWFAVLAFAAALMSKPMVVTLPFVLLLLDWWPFERKIDRAVIEEKWPFFALAIASSLITLRAQHVALGASPFSLRLANALLSYVAYLGKTVWPTQLSIVYPYRTEVSLSAVVLAACLLAAITVAAAMNRHRFPFLLVGWLWYLGTLLPVIGIVQVGHEAMADRYTYIPLIGIFIAIVWSCDALIRQRAWLVVTAAIVLGTLAACTFSQVRYWRNGIILFEHALQVTHDDRHAREGLARELLNAHDYRRAAEEFRIALGQAPRDDEMHNGLGAALMQLGDPTGARREFETAISINGQNAVALRHLGDLNLAEGRTAEAIRLYQRSAELNGDPSTFAVLAAARGNVDDAVALYRRAIAKHPEQAEIRNDLAAVLSKNGRDVEALTEYDQALKIDPHHYEAIMNIGAVLVRLNRNAEAIAYFQRAAMERPESPEPHIYLALVYARTNRATDAVREATTALEINPASANLQFTNAIHIPYDDSNLAGWVEYLRRK